MDKHKAKRLEKELTGKRFGSYTIGKFLDHGKSAAVFQAKGDDGADKAIKIFDNDLVERFGFEIQEARIRQEISLKDHGIKGLVEIEDGGHQDWHGEQYYYVVMEYVLGMNLHEFLKSRTYDDAFIQSVVGMLSFVSEELLRRGIAHRDIKPENIMIRPDGTPLLMDLSVLKLVGTPSFSDEGERQFVGTLRYAPPEFLTRTEEDCEEGWRAINLYQIGAVMHDLIMKLPLFNTVQPFTNLVLSIKSDPPVISSNFQFRTEQLARDLLIKDWKIRLRTCPIQRLLEYSTGTRPPEGTVDSEIEQILAITTDSRSAMDTLMDLQRSRAERLKRARELHTQLVRTIVSGMSAAKERKMFDDFAEVGRDGFVFTDRNMPKECVSSSMLFEIKGTLAQGFPEPLYVFIQTINDDTGLTSISAAAIFMGIRRVRNLQRDALFSAVRDVLTTPTKPSTVRLAQIFFGVASLDERFESNALIALLKLLRNAIQGVRDEVRGELAEQMQRLSGHRGATLKKAFGPRVFVGLE